MGIKQNHDQDWMQQAYEQALLAKAQDEVPVGAVLVSRDQVLLGAAFNQMRERCDPSAHAEIQAIRQACLAQENYRLPETTLYVTLEPCAMCAGAMIQARIGRLVFACRDFKSGAAGSVYNLLQGYPLNHRVCIDEGPMQAECAALLADFFSERRVP